MTIKKEILHFTVHPNIINIIRQAYWYEEGRKEWAMDCLRSLGGNMTFDTAYDLLEGKNGLTTNADGKTLSLTNKPDLKFQKELAKHKKFIEEKNKKIDMHDKRPFCNNDLSYEMDCKYKYHDGKCMYSRMAGYKTSQTSCGGGECYLERFSTIKENKIKNIQKLMGVDESTATGEKVAKKKGEKCFAKSCEFCSNKICIFALRNSWGCFQEDKKVKEKYTEFKLSMTSIGMQGEAGLNFVKCQAEKVFDFKFKEHHYTIKDSARNQGSCPHCDHQSIDDFWRPTDKAYIGHKYFGMKLNILGKKEKSYAVCFKCPKCNKHFFYHTNYKRI